MKRPYVKIFVSVPMRSMTRAIDGRIFDDPPKVIREVIGRLTAHGVGKVGNYDNVSFSIVGKSTYRAIPGSNVVPTAGKIGELHSEEEEMVSFIAPKESMDIALKELKENHPYEVPAIDCIDIIRHEFDCLD